MTHHILTDLGIAGRLSPAQDEVLTSTLRGLEDKVSMQLGEIHRLNASATLNLLIHTENMTKLTRHIQRLEAVLDKAGVSYLPAPAITELSND